MLYIEELYLKGHRTIQGLKATFKPGLNIVIGKNGTGKTNFIEFLAQILRVKKIEIPEYDSQITFKNESSDDVWKLTVKNSIQDDIATHGYIKTDNQVTIWEENGKEKEWPELVVENLENPSKLLPIFIKHGLPSDYSFVKEPLEFRFASSGYSSSIIDFITNANTPHFLKGFFINICFAVNGTNTGAKYPMKADDNAYIQNLSKAFEYIDQLKSPLKKFTNINNIRVKQGFNVSLDTIKHEVLINNLALEYLVNDQWLTFTSLSDGTQRLFYIISEIAVQSNFTYSSGGFGISDKDQPVVVLLEEPELGIHPHMLFDLMQFLKGSAEDKQIILTTHSPQVLDILKTDELDRILISKLNSGQTVLNHLTEEQQSKVASYVEAEAYLSDYWKYSDLEA